MLDQGDFRDTKRIPIIKYGVPGIYGIYTRVLDLPDRLWQLMEIGVGVYILGRTAEKVKGGSEVM
ncbi:MAG TPA: hypothetical protein VI728_04510 [Syntrophales bacterium]|nr:hypothetical protein [Syntrophales bacterium]